MPVAAVAAVAVSDAVVATTSRVASFLLLSVFLSSLALLEGPPVVPLLARSFAALYSTSHARPDEARKDRSGYTHRHTDDAISLSLSLVAKRSYVVPLFAVGVVRTSLSMISCKGPLRSSYSFGRIGPSRHVGYYAADAGNVMKAITISFILSSLWFPSSSPCTHSVHVTKARNGKGSRGRNR